MQKRVIAFLISVVLFLIALILFLSYIILNDRDSGSTLKNKFIGPPAGSVPYVKGPNFTPPSLK